MQGSKFWHGLGELQGVKAAIKSKNLLDEGATKLGDFAEDQARLFNTLRNEPAAIKKAGDRARMDLALQANDLDKEAKKYLQHVLMGALVAEGKTISPTDIALEGVDAKEIKAYADLFAKKWKAQGQEGGAWWGNVDRLVKRDKNGTYYIPEASKAEADKIKAQFSTDSAKNFAIQLSKSNNEKDKAFAKKVWHLYVGEDVKLQPDGILNTKADIATGSSKIDVSNIDPVTLKAHSSQEYGSIMQALSKSNGKLVAEPISHGAPTLATTAAGVPSPTTSPLPRYVVYKGEWKPGNSELPPPQPLDIEQPQTATLAGHSQAVATPKPQSTTGKDFAIHKGMVTNPNGPKQPETVTPAPIDATPDSKKVFLRIWTGLHCGPCKNLKRSLKIEENATSGTYDREFEVVKSVVENGKRVKKKEKIQVQVQLIDNDRAQAVGSVPYTEYYDSDPAGEQNQPFQKQSGNHSVRDIITQQLAK